MDYFCKRPEEREGSNKFQFGLSKCSHYLNRSGSPIIFADPAFENYHVFGARVNFCLKANFILSNSVSFKFFLSFFKNLIQLLL